MTEETPKAPTPDAERERLFFALWPEEAEREALRAATARTVRRCRGRPVPPENFHLTLAFLGPVAREHIPALHALGERLTLPAFDLVLTRLGSFGRARVLWAAPAELPRELAGFERALWDALGTLGYERRRGEAFLPHVTLARRLTRPPRERVELEPAVTWRVRRWALVASETRPEGARYTPRAVWPAAAANTASEPGNGGCEAPGFVK